MYRGKYLSVLHRAASSAGQKTTGIDIFQVAPLALTSADLERELGPQSDLILLERDSSTYSPEELNAVVGGPASWISVDGDHTAEGLFRDLESAEATLAPWGVIALDDFVNCLAIGVVEGSIRYLSNGKTRLRPFVYTANKLLLAFEDYVDTYHEQVPVYCHAYTEYPLNKLFVERYANARSYCDQRLLSRPTWIII